MSFHQVMLNLQWIQMKRFQIEGSDLIIRFIWGKRSIFPFTWLHDGILFENHYFCSNRLKDNFLRQLMLFEFGVGFFIDFWFRINWIDIKSEGIIKKIFFQAFPCTKVNFKSDDINIIFLKCIISELHILHRV